MVYAIVAEDQSLRMCPCAFLPRNGRRSVGPLWGMPLRWSYWVARLDIAAMGMS
jgi:hypothetical protein